jgi:hypothetical protein
LNTDIKSSENDEIRFNNYFNKEPRLKVSNETIPSSDIVKLVFDDIFLGKYRDKVFTKLNNFYEHPILQNLFDEKPLSEKIKKDRVIDEIMYEYLLNSKDLTNKTYFILVVKFTLLFRECINKIRTFDVKANGVNVPQSSKEYTRNNNAETVPELCNEFVTDFLEGNEYFGIVDDNDRSEIIELIQHFCYWLFKNEYTLSRLSLI